MNQNFRIIEETKDYIQTYPTELPPTPFIVREKSTDEYYIIVKNTCEYTFVQLSTGELCNSFYSEQEMYDQLLSDNTVVISEIIVK